MSAPIYSAPQNTLTIFDPLEFKALVLTSSTDTYSPADITIITNDISQNNILINQIQTTLANLGALYVNSNVFLTSQFGSLNKTTLSATVSVNIVPGNYILSWNIYIANKTGTSGNVYTGATLSFAPNLLNGTFQYYPTVQGALGMSINGNCVCQVTTTTSFSMSLFVGGTNVSNTGQWSVIYPNTLNNNIRLVRLK